jgi:AcrR family transcriptional regulator
MVQVVPSVNLGAVTKPEAGLNPQVARSRAAAMDAGREILVSDGWEAVTFVAVAERSGVGRTTLYRHWPTIDRFVYDILLREWAVEHHTPTGDTREDLVEELDDFRIRLHDPAVERPMLTTMDRASRDPAFAQLSGDLYEASSAAAAQIIRAGQERGDIDACLDLARAVAELAGPLIYQRLLGRRTLDREFVEHVVDDFLRAHSAPPADRR